MAKMLSLISFTAVVGLLLLVGAGVTAVSDPGVKLAISALILLGLVSAAAGLGRNEQAKRLQAWAESKDDHEKRIQKLERLAGYRKAPHDNNPFPVPPEFRKKQGADNG